MSVAFKRTVEPLEPEVRADFERFAADFAYLQQNKQKLTASYPDEWVALYGEKVIDHSTSLDVLLNSLRASGIAPDKALVDFLATEQRTLIL